MAFVCCLVLLIFIVVTNPVAAGAGAATDAIKKTIHDGIALLRDPAVKTEEQRREKADQMWAIIRQAFDFRLISVLALGKNWQHFTPEQKREFSVVFSQLLGKTYISKIQGEYKDEEVFFVDEEVFSSKKAVVKTIIKRQKRQISVDYKMHFGNGKWMVYDITVEGIGLVLNYRRQFDTFLAKDGESPQNLIAKLKKKLEKRTNKN